MPVNNPSHEAQPVKPGLSEQVGQSTHQAAEKVHQAAEKAVAQVRDVRARAESSIEDQRGLIAGRVRRLGVVLRDSSLRLAAEDAFERDLLDVASARVQRIADYVEQASVHDVVDDLNTLARTRPGLFFGSAFLAGLALGRFAKSSQHPRETTKQREPEKRAEPEVLRMEGGAKGLDLEAAGRASASGIHYSAPTVDEPPKPQPGDASRDPRAVQPGEGTKS